MIHTAPAGTSYGDIFHAGSQNLQRYAYDFPLQNNSATLPPIFTTKYTERVDATTKKPVLRPDLLQPRTQRQREEVREYEGLVGNHAGAEGERIVFEKLNAIVKEQPADALLVLYNYEVNLPKLQALSVDAPTTLKYLENFLKSF